MKARPVIVKPEFCSGCRTCQLICSWFRQNVFNPAKAFIKVEVNDRNMRHHIYFEEQCTGCGLCARYCVSRVLRLAEGVENVDAAS
ncbi:MAG: 4Fe-4S dicluster domain-containing protein [Clostridia bacterium]|nr:4Fe-4S dicluster domain-containing protein [Clostridia bacterium]